MHAKALSLIIQGIGVLATLAIVILAIWGDRIRARLTGPKIELSQFDPDGDLTQTGLGSSRRYYHLRVENKRKGTIAQGVYVVLNSIYRPAADGSWAKENISGPLQLHWQFQNQSPQYPNIGAPRICDIGYLDQIRGFVISVYVKPNNFNNTVGPGKKARIEVIAYAENAESKPMTLEVHWDGSWSKDSLDMRKHMIVRPI
jgi:hypothetical protein